MEIIRSTAQIYVHRMHALTLLSKKVKTCIVDVHLCPTTIPISKYVHFRAPCCIYNLL